MTWQHVFLVMMALIAPVLCGMTQTCHDMLPALKDLSLAVVAGTMGNAMRTAAQQNEKSGDIK